MNQGAQVGSCSDPDQQRGVPSPRRSRRPSRIIRVVVTAGASFAVAATGCWSEPSDDVVPSPDTAGMERRVAALIHETRQAVLEQPNSAEAWGRFAMASEVHRLLDVAETCYRRAWNLDPNDFRYPYNLAVVLESQGIRPDETVRLLRAAAELEPSFAPIYHRIGAVLTRHGKLAEARDAFTKSIELDPNLAITQHSLGLLLLRLGEPQSARAHLERAAQLAPNHGSVYAALAQAYSRLGQRQRAAVAAEKSRGPTSRLTLPDQVRAQVRAMGVSSNHFFDRAQPLVAAGQYAKALPHLRIVEKARPNDPHIQLWLGLAYVSTNQPNVAFEHLSKAVQQFERQPTAAQQRDDLPLAHMHLGVIQLTRRRPQEAIQHFRRALAHAPQNAQVHSYLATALSSSGQFQEAVQEFEQAAVLGPLAARDHVNWASALVRLGMPEQGIDHYREAIRLNPRLAPAHYQLGQTFEMLGRKNEAIQQYKRTTQIDPTHRAAQRLAQLVAEKK